jgi:hypothetical protein
MDMTILEYFGHAPVAQFNVSKAIPLSVADPVLIMGAELEIEQLPLSFEPSRAYGGSWKTDGSLRNNGYEFVSNPATLSSMAYIIGEVFKKNLIRQDTNYSERCSIHIHANCQDLAWKQVATICLLYQTFEHLLFNFIGGDRNKNIFCVPWYETQLTYNIIDTMLANPGYAIKKWQKYTALNLLPLMNLGTIEFRHMAGNCDTEFIVNWANLIGCMFAYARTHTLDEVKAAVIMLNTNSQYRGVLESVFGKWSDLLRSNNYEELLEEGVINMKYCLMKPPTGKVQLDPAQPPSREQIDEMIRQHSEFLRAPRAAPNPVRTPRVISAAPGSRQALNNIIDDYTRNVDMDLSSAPLVREHGVDDWTRSAWPTGAFRSPGDPVDVAIDPAQTQPTINVRLRT